MRDLSVLSTSEISVLLDTLQVRLLASVAKHFLQVRLLTSVAKHCKGYLESGLSGSCWPELRLTRLFWEDEDSRSSHLRITRRTRIRRTKRRRRTRIRRTRRSMLRIKRRGKIYLSLSIAGQ